MKLNYKHIIFDYDDTLVDGTRSIHHPAYLEIVKKIRPNYQALELEDWRDMLHNKGLGYHYREELGFNDKELKEEYEIWREFNEKNKPAFFDGILNILRTQKKLGGDFSIISYSQKDIILKNFEDLDVKPSRVYGSEHEYKKPSPEPVYEILNDFNLKKDEVIMVGDSSPDLKLSQNSGIKIIGAGWAFKVKSINDYMKENCDYFCNSIKDLEKILFH